MSSPNSRCFALLALVAGLCGCTPSSQTVERLEWPEMGTVAALSFRSVPCAKRGAFVADVKAVYSSLAAKLNAWNPDSELSRLVTTNGWRSSVSPEVRPCYAAAFRLMDESRGAFNPLLAARLREKGFTRHAALLDLGAIAKGFAVDCAYEALAKGNARPPDLLVDLGGNLRACGGTWKVGVRNPFGSGLCATVELQPGEALATSGTYERGSHILDGRTGETAASGVASVTVLAPTAMLADGLSTTLFVLGAAEGREFLLKHYPAVAVLWVLADGSFVGFDEGGRFCRESFKRQAQANF